VRKSILFIIVFLLLAGCQQSVSTTQKEKVGLLVPTTINEPIWGSKGYRGLLQIQTELGAEVYYKEEMETEADVRKAVREMNQKGVSIIFGHGKEYEPFFKAIHQDYPNIQFIYFNGSYTADNVVSINFEAFASGFFAGMVAAEMSKTNEIGLIAAYEWQQEVKGFEKGAIYQNPETKVYVNYTYDWDDITQANALLEDMMKKGVDVFYPAGDAFNIPVIKKVKENNLYVIGFISDQIDFGRETVLTSTVQHIDKVYEEVTRQYINGQLQEGIYSYDFKDGFITMGEFSPSVPTHFKERINGLIKRYIETDKLPNK
jgi:transcriptional activator of comK gene